MSGIPVLEAFGTESCVGVDDEVRAALQAGSRDNLGDAEPRVKSRLQHDDFFALTFVIVRDSQKIECFRAAHGAISKIEFSHVSSISRGGAICQYKVDEQSVVSAEKELLVS